MDDHRVLIHKIQRKASPPEKSGISVKVRAPEPKSASLAVGTPEEDPVDFTLIESMMLMNEKNTQEAARSSAESIRKAGLKKELEQQVLIDQFNRNSLDL